MRTPEQRAELLSRVCDALEGGALSVTSACKIADVPESTVYAYADDPERYGIDTETIERYARARAGIISAAINRVRSFAERPDGDDAVRVSRDRLGLDAEKWLLARLMPKTLGDRVVHQGDRGADPIKGSVAIDLSNEPQEVIDRLVAIANAANIT